MVDAYESPIHGLLYDLPLVSMLQVFFEIWSAKYGDM